MRRGAVPGAEGALDAGSGQGAWGLRPAASRARPLPALLAQTAAAAARASRGWEPALRPAPPAQGDAAGIHGSQASSLVAPSVAPVSPRAGATGRGPRGSLASARRCPGGTVGDYVKSPFPW